MKWRAAPGSERAAVGDFARYPGARLLLSCAACGLSKDYDPERVIDRLRKLKVGGYETPMVAVAQRVRRACPGCGRLEWRADFAWSPSMSESEIKRIANRYRN